MRGYQKKVIYVKNTGSSVFEEAYFVLSSEGENKERSELDMVEEANRIIEENFGKKRRKLSKKYPALIGSFLAGALFSFIIIFLI